MNPFPNIPDENIPGLDRFLFAPVDDVAVVGDAINHLISSITWQSGKGWLEGFSEHGTLEVEEVPEETDHGTLYKCKVKGLLSKDSPTLAAYLKELKGYRYLVALKDLNEVWKLYGSLEKPCLFSFGLSKDAENNHYEFSFSAIHTDEAPYFLDESII